MTMVAVVGRPNVGKSTLFNRICRRRHSLVDDLPGVTRDRITAQVSYEGKTFTLVDTGGFVSGDPERIAGETREQVLLALEEADAILFVSDAKTGVHPEDVTMADLLRRTEKPVFYVVNKVDGPEQEALAAEFYALGVDRVYAVSAAHGRGIHDLLEDLTAAMPEDEPPEEETEADAVIRVAVVGRPNVGKSTLVNQILGERRVIVSPTPGTTRDAVDTLFEKDGRRYLLIDTAGIRRKGRTYQKLEKLSIIKALGSIDRCHVAVVLLDALEGVTDQDLHIGGYVQERNRGCVIGLNKWDTLEKDPKAVRRLLDEVKGRFRFLPHAPILTFSALSGKRVAKLLPAVREVYEQYALRIGTGVVNRVLAEALERHEPPLVSGRRLKFYYATQASTRPPTFVLFCNDPERVHFSYARFLTNHFRESFGMDKTPVRLLFRLRTGREANR